MPGPGLSEDLELLLLDLSGEIDPRTQRRWTTRDLAGYCLAQHGVQVHHATIARRLKELRTERGEVAREVLKDQLLRALPTQFLCLDELAQELSDRVQREGEARTTVLEVLDLVRLTEGYRKVLVTKAALAGLVARIEVTGDLKIDATVSITDARAALAASLTRLAEGVDPRATPPAPGKPS